MRQKKLKTLAQNGPFCVARALASDRLQLSINHLICGQGTLVNAVECAVPESESPGCNRGQRNKLSLEHGKDNPPHSRSASPEKNQSTEIDDHGVSQAIEPLVKAGCCRERLLHDLQAIKIAYEVYDRNRLGSELFPRFTFDDYFGFDRKSFKTVLKRMRQCADDVETLCRKLGSGRVLEIFKPDLSPAERDAHAEHLSRRIVAPGFVVPPNIPDSLRILHDAVEKESKQATFRERPIYDEALEAVLRYVRETTGDWYYERVAAALRAGVTLKDTPDGAALCDWAHTRPGLQSLFCKS